MVGGQSSEYGTACLSDGSIKNTFRTQGNPGVFPTGVVTHFLG